MTESGTQLGDTHSDSDRSEEWSPNRPDPPAQTVLKALGANRCSGKDEPHKALRGTVILNETIDEAPRADVALTTVILKTTSPGDVSHVPVPVGDECGPEDPDDGII